MISYSLAEYWELGSVVQTANVFTTKNFIYSTYTDNTIFMGWSILYFIAKYRNDYETEKIQNQQSVLFKENAELQLLRYQLNPHFLFNSLNSIRALTLKKPEEAREMVSELSEFFKYSVVTKNALYISLEKEVEALKHYLRIEQIRFKDKLQIQYHINEEVKKFHIPILLLHPIIENALKYGMKTAEFPLSIIIRANKQRNNCIIEISNNGKWIETDERDKLGIIGTSSGLQNVKDRLANSYRENHSFEIIKEENLVSVKITIGQ